MGILAPLRIVPLPRLLSSYFVNELGDTFGAIALAILVFDQTGDPLATTGLFVASRFIPALLAPALTARLDQAPSGRTLGVLYAIEALGFLALAWLATRFALVPILVLALIDGTLALTARGITRGVIAATLGGGEDLRAGNALVNVAFAVASVGGALLAGALISGVGAEAGLLVDAASFLLVAVMLATCRTLPAADGERAPYRDRLKETFRHVRDDRFLRTLLGAQAVALVLFTLIVPIEVVYAKETLHAGDVGFGVLLGTWGGGMLIGSALFVAARRLPLSLIVVLATGLIGAGYLGMGLVHSLAAAAAFSVLGGIGNGIQVVSVITLLQHGTPSHLRVRVSGLLESLGAAMPGIGFVLGGLLTSATSASTTFVVAGVSVLLLTAALALSDFRVSLSA